jgi:hypothetical protein
VCSDEMLEKFLKSRDNSVSQPVKKEGTPIYRKEINSVLHGGESSVKSREIKEISKQKILERGLHRMNETYPRTQDCVKEGED